MTAAELHSRLSVPSPVECMGLRLLPFTIGHARLMDHLGCSGLVDEADLSLSVIICSRKPSKVLAFLNSWLLPLRLMVWRWYLKAWDPHAEMAKFCRYLKEHTQLPAIIPQGGGATHSNPIPHHQKLRVVMISRLGYKPSDVDSTPYLQALWDVITLTVSEGRANALDQTDEDIAELEASIDWHDVFKRASEVKGFAQ